MPTSTSTASLRVPAANSAISLFAPRYPNAWPSAFPNYLPFSTVRTSALTPPSSTRPPSAPDFDLHSLEPHHIPPLIQMIRKVAQLPNLIRQKECLHRPAGRGAQ